MLTSLDGKSVVVTGASKGIGKGIARVFRQGRRKVLVVARHLDAKPKPAAKEIGDGAPRPSPPTSRDLASMEAMAQGRGRATWRHRYPLRQCRHLPAGTSSRR